MNVFLTAARLFMFTSSKQMPENSPVPKHQDVHQAKQTAPQIFHSIDRRVSPISASRQLKVTQSGRLPVENLEMSQQLSAKKASQKNNESKSDSRQLVSLKKSHEYRTQHRQNHKSRISSSRFEDVMHLDF